MNYSKYLKEPSLLERLLIKLGILKKMQMIIELDLTPDPDILPNDWRIIDNNYFKNSWSFGDYFSSVTRFTFRKQRVYHSDDIKEAENELDIYLYSYDIVEALNIIHDTDPDYFSHNGYDQNLNEDFKLHNVRVTAIDNVKKKIRYDGSFLGNHECYDQLDWGTFSKIRVVGIPKALESFHLELIGESYVLYKNGNYKLSYFMAYTALENYVNTGLADPEWRERFNNKLKKHLKGLHGNLGTHQIYTSTMAFLNSFTTVRNTIAHGNTAVEIDSEQAWSAVVFVCTLIVAFHYHLPTFDELLKEI